MNDTTGPNGAQGPLEARVRLCRMPIGTRFQYTTGGRWWVLVSAQGCGLIAAWDGPIPDYTGQTFCSAADSRAGFLAMDVSSAA